jgi:hypothetical protein
VRLRFRAVHADFTRRQTDADIMRLDVPTKCEPAPPLARLYSLAPVTKYRPLTSYRAKAFSIQTQDVFPIYPVPCRAHNPKLLSFPQSDDFRETKGDCIC